MEGEMKKMGNFCPVCGAPVYAISYANETDEKSQFWLWYCTICTWQGTTPGGTADD